MKSLREHQDHTNITYGVMIQDVSDKTDRPLVEIDGGKLIHEWVDGPVSVLGVNHRIERHGIDSLPTVVKLFGGIYGDELAKNIFLDHIVADVRGNTRVHNSLPKKTVENLNTQQKKDKYNNNTMELSRKSHVSLYRENSIVDIENRKTKKEKLIDDIMSKPKAEKLEQENGSLIVKKKEYDDNIDVLRKRFK